MEEICICGEVIPEGMTVCPYCEIEDNNVLNPCPKCGGEAKFIRVGYDGGVSKGVVRCAKCKCGQIRVRKKRQVIADWNMGIEDRL